MIGFVPAGYIIADVAHLSVVYPQSFSSVVCYPKNCIHGFKSTQKQRGELKDKRYKAKRYY